MVVLIVSHQLYYAGDDELPAAAIQHIQHRFDDVRVVDITSVRASSTYADYILTYMPYRQLPETPSVPLRGYQIKPIAIMVSSFQEACYAPSP